MEPSSNNNTGPPLFIMLMNKGFAALVLMHHIFQSDIIDFEFYFPVHPLAPHHQGLVSFMLTSFKKSNKRFRIKEFLLIVLLDWSYFAFSHDVGSFFEIVIGLDLDGPTFRFLSFLKVARYSSSMELSGSSVD